LIICGIKEDFGGQIGIVLHVCGEIDVLVQSYEVTLYFALHMFLLNEGIVS
jgi:hypothetical protein